MSTLTQDRYFESKIVGLLSNPGNSRLVDENIEKLKLAIKYLNYLKDSEELSDKDYSALITSTYARFVKNEMASVIDEVLGSAVKDLEKTFERFNDEWR